MSLSDIELVADMLLHVLLVSVRPGFQYVVKNSFTPF